MTADDHEVYNYVRYTEFLYSFIQKAFAAGIFYDKLDDSEISELDGVLRLFSLQAEQNINNSIIQWLTNDIQKAFLVRLLQFQQEQITKSKSTIDRILKKL